MTDKMTQNWRNTDPATSKEAGQYAEKVFTKNHRALILQIIQDSERPLSAEEIARELGWINHVPVNRRLSELKNKGHIKVVDAEYRNISGRRAERYADGRAE